MSKPPESEFQKFIRETYGPAVVNQLNNYGTLFNKVPSRKLTRWFRFKVWFRYNTKYRLQGAWRGFKDPNRWYWYYD